MFDNVEWIFFDVGYTLINEDAVWECRCREQAMTDEGVKLGLTAEDIYHTMQDASAHYQPQYRTVIKKYNFTEIAPYRHELEVLYDDAREVLQQLSSKYKLGIIANQPLGLQERLQEAGISQYLDLIISSWDYQVLKPDVKLFEIALEQAACTPSQAIMIGDRLDNDIYPAKKLGMKTIWMRKGFGGTQKPISEEYIPDKEVNNLAELLELLK